MKLLITAALGSMLTSSLLSFEDRSTTDIPYRELTHNTMDIEIADLDADGDDDIVLAMEFKPNIILINDGDGKFNNESADRLPQVVHDSEDIAIGDFDKDGDPDIIFASEDDRIHEYYLNDGKGVFSDNSKSFAFTSTANAIDAADYDKDGDLDIILGNQGQDIYLVNDGKGNFKEETRDRFPADNNTTQDVQHADLDNDGDLDLVMGNEDGNRLYLNDGEGRFTDVTEKQLPVVIEETRKARLADVDNDGDLDIFFCNVDFRKINNKANRLLINNGKAVFKDESAGRLKMFNDMHTGDVAFADLDHDGDKDMILANLFGGHVQAALNDGKGVFTDATEKFFPIAIKGDAISIEICDLNKDKLPDIYIGMFRSADKYFKGRNQ